MDPVFIIIIIFGGFAIGGMTGYFAAKQWLKKTQVISPVLPSARSAKSELTRAGYHPLLSLWRKQDDESLAMEIEGVMFADRASMSAEAVRRNAGVAREWLTWLGAGDAPAGHPDVSVDRMPLISEIHKPVKAEKAPAVGPTRAEVLEEAENKRIEAEQKLKTFRIQTIAEQIDAILQEKIVEDGMTGRDIRIIEDVKHSVIFQVGDKNYHSLDELEDPDALRLIRAAVAEWEKRTANNRRR